MLQNTLHEFQKQVDKAFNYRYKIGYHQGEGASAVVHQAVRLSDKLIVAIKFVDKKDRQIHSLTRDSIRIHQQLQKHKNPNILVFHEWAETVEYFMIVTEVEYNNIYKFCPLNVQQLMDNSSQKTISEATALIVLRQLLNAVSEMHREDIIHRDLKLDNIMVQVRDESKKLFNDKKLTSDQILKENSIRLIDFGISRHLDSSIRERAMSFAGTPSTMAPEIQYGQPYDFKADIYSLGVIAFQMVQNRYPYPNIFYVPNVQPEMKWDEGIKISQEYKQLVYKMCQFDQEKRIDCKKIWEEPLLSLKTIPSAENTMRMYEKKGRSRITLIKEPEQKVKIQQTQIKTLEQSPKKLQSVQPNLRQLDENQQKEQLIFSDQFLKKYQVNELIVQKMQIIFVYMGRRKEDNYPVTIKVIRKDSSHDKQISDYITRSVSIHQKLQSYNNPNILHFIESIECQKYLYIVTEYCPVNMFHYFCKNFPNGLPEALALTILRQIINAVSELHRHKIIHRDLKLENLLVQVQDDVLKEIEDGTLKKESLIKFGIIRLKEFGLSKQIESTYNGRLSMIGLSISMAPEVRMNKHVGIKADIYSIGIIANYLVNGYLQYGNEFKYPKGISKEYQELVAQMCQQDADRRLHFRQLWKVPILDMNGFPLAASTNQMYQIMLVEEEQSQQLQHHNYEYQNLTLIIDLCKEIDKPMFKFPENDKESLRRRLDELNEKLMQQLDKQPNQTPEIKAIKEKIKQTMNIIPKPKPKPLRSYMGFLKNPKEKQKSSLIRITQHFIELDMEASNFINDDNQDLRIKIYIGILKTLEIMRRLTLINFDIVESLEYQKFCLNDYQRFIADYVSQIPELKSKEQIFRQTQYFACSINRQSSHR